MHNLAGYIIIIYATALDVYDGCKRYKYDGKIISYHNAMFRLSFMMTSSNGNMFRVTGPLYGEFTGSPHKGQ